MKRFFIFLFYILLFSSFGYAEIDSFNIDFVVIDKDVYVEEIINLSNKQNFSIFVPDDAEALSLYLDGKPANYSIMDDNIDVFAKNIRINYLTKTPLDRNTFLTEFVAPDNVKDFIVKLTLPRYAVLARPVEEGTLVSNAIFPTPNNIGTDGQKLIISWDFTNFKKNDTIAFLVMYGFERNYYVYITIGLGMAVLALVYIVLWLRKKTTPKIKLKARKPRKRVVSNESVLERYLKEDEEQVVNILKQREGQCEQGTLRVITGFSKAKLSGLLKELEERNIVYKEKRGKKNLVFLRE